MLNIIKKTLKEPLIHFLLLGSLIYLFYIYTQESTQNIQEEITLQSYEIQALKDKYKKKNTKDINNEELEAYSEHALYEKKLLNEAYKLNLYKQSKEISQILLKQMKFIRHNKSLFKEPTEEELLTYYKKNIQEYAQIDKLSFSHIYFLNTKDKGIAKIYEIATTVGIDPNKAGYFGNASSISNYLDDVTQDEIQKSFGKYFAKQLFSLKSGVWHKAIHSKHGVHLVYVRDKVTGEPYPFDDVLQRVYQDFLQEKQLKDK